MTGLIHRYAQGKRRGHISIHRFVHPAKFGYGQNKQDYKPSTVKMELQALDRSPAKEREEPSIIEGKDIYRIYKTLTEEQCAAPKPNVPLKMRSRRLTNTCIGRRNGMTCRCFGHFIQRKRYDAHQILLESFLKVKYNRNMVVEGRQKKII